MKLRRYELWSAAAVVVALAIVASPARAARWVVHEGESIQAAIDNASPGDTIIVMPGTYVENPSGINAVTIHKDGIRLIGRPRRRRGEKVILQAAPGQENGIVVEPDPSAPPDAMIQRFTIRGFTVQGFAKYGINVRRTRKFKIDRNESANNLDYGIFPQLSADGVVRHNISYGSNDSALWVETSVNVKITRNIVHTSVTGIEVSNSEKITVRRNEAYNNVVGIGLYHLTNMEVKIARDWRVSDNYVHDNNKVNTADPDSIASLLPTGGGILVLGVDESTIKRNRIENNDFYGIAVVDYCLAVAGTPFDCSLNPPDIDPSPDNNRFLHNRLINNGTNPDPTNPFAPLASDIIVLGGTNNCFRANSYSTSVPPTLPPC